MSIPEATLTIKDGALGIAGSADNGIDAKVGCCSAGEVNRVYQFTDNDTLVDTLGSGPLVEAAAFLLAVAGGPVVCVRTPSSTPGEVDSVTPDAGVTGTATFDVDGAALDSYDLKVVMVNGADDLADLDASFKYSLDGGRTYSPTIAMPLDGEYEIPDTGLTLAWTETTGTGFVAEDFWTAVVLGPASSADEIGDAIDVLMVDPTVVFNVHVLGIPEDLAAAASLFAALDLQMSSAAESQFRYLYATMELAPGDEDDDISDTFSDLASTRVEVAAGYHSLSSPLSGAAISRPAGWSSTARAAAVVPSEDLGRVATGNLKGVAAIERDESKTPALDAAHFTTLRTFIGLKGFYLTNGRLMAPEGSDFQLIQHRRVMDVGSTVVRAAQLHYLNDSVRVNAPGSENEGLILEEDARAIDAYIEGKMRDALTSKGYASAVSARVDRTVNIISTETLVVKYRITPLGYAKAIEGEIAFENPALQLV